MKCHRLHLPPIHRRSSSAAVDRPSEVAKRDTPSLSLLVWWMGTSFPPLSIKVNASHFLQARINPSCQVRCSSLTNLAEALRSQLQVNMMTRNKEKDNVHIDDYILKRRDDEPKQSEKQPNVATKKKKVLNDEEKQPRKKRKVLNEAEKLFQLKMNYMGSASCRCTVKYVNEKLHPNMP